MEKNIISLLIICFFLLDPLCSAQTSIIVSDPRLELKDNIIQISYDILNSKPSDNYIISIEIKDSVGNDIEARALTGDIGEDVSGGNNKLITWNLSEDKILMNSEILVSVYAEPVLPVESIVEEKAVDDVSKDVTKKVIAKDFNRSGIILQSLVFPGLGLSRVTGNPHWIKGAAGYGCIAGSIVLNRVAISTYDDFRTSHTPENAESLLTASTRWDNISEVLAYTAIGIWVSDFIWTFIGSSDLKKESLYSETGGISIQPGYDPLTKSPVIGLSYRF